MSLRTWTAGLAARAALALAGESKSGTWDTFREHIAAIGTSKAGAAVTVTTGMQVPAMFACARLIAEGCAQVPFKVHRVVRPAPRGANPDADPAADPSRSGSGPPRSSTSPHREDATDHPLYWLLALRPNEWQTSVEFRETLLLHLIFCGNAFVVLNRVRGRVVELLPYEPGAVTVKRANDGSLSYTLRLAAGQQIPVPAANMWHLRGPSWNTWMGLDTTRVAREALGLALAAEEHSARMFSNGARLGGILSSDMHMKQEQVDLIRSNWEQTQGGLANAYKTAVLFGGLKFQPVGMQSDQAQLIEQRRFQVEEICRHLRVLPIMVGAGEKTSTYASVEQMMIAHVTYTLMPWYTRIEQSAMVHLLTRDEIEAGVYIKFNANALLRGSAEGRGRFYAALYNVGAINPNEIRALEDMNPYAGGDQFRVPLNMADPAASGADPTPDDDRGA